MAAVQFTAMLCKPITAFKAQRKPSCYNKICPRTKDTTQPGLEGFITFLYVFRNVEKVFVN